MSNRVSLFVRPFATILLLALCAQGGAQQPAPFKIAVVDMEKVFQNYYKTKIADANLKKQAETYRNYLTSLSDSNLKLREEFKELRDDSQNIALKVSMGTPIGVDSRRIRRSSKTTSRSA